MRKLLAKNRKSQRGASLIEYILIAALISVASVAAMQATNTSIQTVWTAIQTGLGLGG